MRKYLSVYADRHRQREKATCTVGAQLSVVDIVMTTRLKEVSPFMQLSLYIGALISHFLNLFMCVS